MTTVQSWLESNGFKAYAEKVQESYPQLNEGLLTEDWLAQLEFTRLKEGEVCEIATLFN